MLLSLSLCTFSLHLSNKAVKSFYTVFGLGESHLQLILKKEPYIHPRSSQHKYKKKNSPVKQDNL